MTTNKRLNITPSWYTNSAVRPKRFKVTLERDSSGNYTVIRGSVKAVVNQHETRDQKIDVRDLTADIKRAVRNRRMTVR
jgi:hypothetical protein